MRPVAGDDMDRRGFVVAAVRRRGGDDTLCAPAGAAGRGPMPLKALFGCTWLILAVSL